MALVTPTLLFLDLTTLIKVDHVGVEVRVLDELGHFNHHLAISNQGTAATIRPGRDGWSVT